MVSPLDLVVVESVNQPPGTCIVCGNAIAAGEGISARLDGRLLRFKCPGCFERFQSDPLRYLAGDSQGCCGGAHDHSPASEWQA